MLGFGSLGEFALGEFPIDGNAAGVTITATASIIAGAATGNANATGSTITAIASVIAGAATGAAAAAGATITATASTIDGSATGAGNAGGSTVTSGASLDDGTATGDGSGDGALLPVGVELLAGSAAGDANASGEIFSRQFASLLAGQASAGAPGSTIEVVSSLLGGIATGDAGAAGSTIDVAIALLPGEATGGQPLFTGLAGAAGSPRRRRPPAEPVRVDGYAPGTAIAAGLELVPGFATGAVSVQLRGRLGRSGAGIIAGDARGDAVVVANDNELPIAIDLVSGKAIGSELISGRAIVGHLEAGVATGFDGIAHDNDFLLMFG